MAPGAPQEDVLGGGEAAQDEAPQSPQERGEVRQREEDGGVEEADEEEEAPSHLPFAPSSEGSPPPAEASAASAVTSRCSTNLLTSLKSTAPRYRPLTGHCRPGKVHNESSCSSPADGTPRSPAEESPRSHSSPCRSGTSRSSPSRLSDSGQQPHPRNMDDEIDILDAKIMSMIGKITSSVPNMTEGWYSCPTGIKYLLEQLAVQEAFKTFTNEMLKERIEKLERMVKDYKENKRSLPEKRMLYVFSHIARQHECVPDTPQRTALVSEEREAPSPKRPRSESVDMAMYLSQPEAASKIFLSRFSMEDCTYKAQQLFEGDMLYSALALLRKDIEIRQSFMTLEDSAARGHIEYELKISGQNPTH